MLEKYIEDQPIVTRLLINSINNNRIVQAYLFVSEDKNFLMDFSLDFSKLLISKKEDNKIYNLIDNRLYPELKIIEPVNNNIKKEELSSLQDSFKVKPTLGDKLVYIINGADKLNQSSANTILKFLEEPSDDIVAILLTDNLSKVLPTIKSRCQNIIFNNKNNENKIDYLFKQYSINKDDEYGIDDFRKQIGDVVILINNIEKTGLSIFMHYKSNIMDLFPTKEDMFLLFDFMLYFYYDMLNYILKRDIIYMNDYKDDIEFNSKNNDINKIQKKLQLIEESKNKLNTNMNLKLLLDDFIIKYSEV